MAENRWCKNSRQIVERIIIRGELVLQTPTHLGNGDNEDLIDMALLLDEKEQTALLTGASLAGALRSYLHSRESGFRARDEQKRVETLFGYQKGEESAQSYLLTRDAHADSLETELRDGVALDPKTRTAEDRKKFDVDLLSAGTRFALEFELLVPKAEASQMRSAAAAALQGFERGEIRLGMRKRRGYGQCTVKSWQVERYDLCAKEGLLAWLGRQSSAPSAGVSASGAQIADLICSEEERTMLEGLDARELFTLDADFQIDGSLLIRSGGNDPKAPDMVHLKSKRGDAEEAVLSGTALAGALRHRALKIGATVGDADRARTLVDSLFGPRIEGSETVPSAGRIWVDETVIDDPLELVVTRVKIDRFTGGSYPGALFDQQPLYGTPATNVKVSLQVRNPTDADMGLLLLLLKDLWTSDLPLGGEAAVGRGRLAGKRATLALKRKDPLTAVSWEIEQEASGALSVVGDPADLEQRVCAFYKEMQP